MIWEINYRLLCFNRQWALLPVPDSMPVSNLVLLLCDLRGD
jgi:hypothetical protein